MTQGSEPPYAARMAELAARFERAVVASFGFLGELGFRACPPVLRDLEDLRDARVSHRYTRGNDAGISTSAS